MPHTEEVVFQARPKICLKLSPRCWSKIVNWTRHIPSHAFAQIEIVSSFTEEVAIGERFLNERVNL